jgi:hypothetical protein
MYALGAIQEGIDMDDFGVKPNKAVGVGSLQLAVDTVAREYKAFWLSFSHADP